MSAKLLDIARSVVKGALQRGAEAARASAYRRGHGAVEWRDGKIDRLFESTDMGVSVTAFVEGRFSSNATSDLRPEALGRFLDEVVSMTRVLTADPHRKLPDRARYENRYEGDLGLFDEEGLGKVSAIGRREAAAELEASARASSGADRIISVTTSCSDQWGEGVLVASNGMEGARRTSSFWANAEVSVRGEGDKRPEGYDYGGGTHQRMLPSLETVGRRAIERAIRQIGAAPEKSGVYPCIVENAVAGRLVGQLIGALHGGAIQQKRSFLAGKLGQEVAGSMLTITDEPHLVHGFGSSAFDGEGMSTMRRPLFEQGVLCTYLLDTYYASKLGLEPTTGGTSNLVFAAGTRDLEALLAAMDRGILVTGFSGGNCNPATGNFSVGVKGHFIEHGKRARPIAEMNLSGNHLELWKHLTETGNDPFAYSAMRCPSLFFREAQFSGV
jgi:PmbA protein